MAKIVNIQTEQEAKAFKAMLNSREDLTSYLATQESETFASKFVAILSPLMDKEEKAYQAVNAAFTPLGELVYNAKEAFNDTKLSWDAFLSSTGNFKTRGMREAFGVSESTAKRYLNLYLATNRKVRDGWNPDLMKSVDVRLHSAKKSETLGRVHDFLDSEEGDKWKSENEADINASTANAFAGTLIKEARIWYAEQRNQSAKKSNRERLIASMRAIYLMGRKDIPKASREKAFDEYSEGLSELYVDLGKILASDTYIPGLAAYSRTKAETKAKETVIPAQKTA